MVNRILAILLFVSVFGLGFKYFSLNDVAVESEVSLADEGILEAHSLQKDDLIDSIDHEPTNALSASTTLTEEYSESPAEKRFSVDSAPPLSLLEVGELGFVPAQNEVSNDYAAYDAQTLKQLARNGDGRAASIIATDWSFDRAERIEIAMIAARNGAPAALHLLASGEFEAASFLPEGYKTLEESYPLYLASLELLKGKMEDPGLNSVARYEATLSAKELASAKQRADQFVSEIRRL